MSDTETKITCAAKLFKSFHGRAPDDNEIVAVELPSHEIGLVIGEVDGIMYKTKEDDKPFLHRFGEKSGNRPLLVVTSDGTQAFILKGGYRFTSRGFID